MSMITTVRSPNKQEARRETCDAAREPKPTPKHINRVTCVCKAFCTGPRILATSSLSLLRSEDTVFTRCVYSVLL